MDLYTVDINGIKHVVRAGSAERAAKFGKDPEKVEPTAEKKAAPKPANKARTPRNKAADKPSED